MAALDRPLHTPEIHFLVVDWRDGFEIGVADVDAEHRHLFSLVKALSLESAESTMRELLDYVVTHFTHEQELMEASGYPGLPGHLALHEQFSMQVAEFLVDESSWDDLRVRELRKFLNKWLVGHILTHDLRFGRWYQSRKHARFLDEMSQHQPRTGWLNRLFGRS